MGEIRSIELSYGINNVRDFGGGDERRGTVLMIGRKGRRCTAACCTNDAAMAVIRFFVGL